MRGNQELMPVNFFLNEFQTELYFRVCDVSTNDREKSTHALVRVLAFSLSLEDTLMSFIGIMNSFLPIRRDGEIPRKDPT